MSSRVDRGSSPTGPPESPSPRETPRRGPENGTPSRQEAWMQQNPGMPGNFPRSQNARASCDTRVPAPGQEQSPAESYIYRRGIGGLVDRGRDLLRRKDRVVQEQNNRALRRAAGDGNIQMVGELVTVANLDAPSPAGHTPLHNAVRSGNEEVVRQLLVAGADPNLPDRRTGRTALHYAAEQGNHRIITALRADHRTNADIPDHSGRLPVDSLRTRSGQSRSAAGQQELDHIFGADRLARMALAPQSSHTPPYSGLAPELAGDGLIRDNENPPEYPALAPSQASYGEHGSERAISVEGGDTRSLPENADPVVSSHGVEAGKTNAAGASHAEHLAAARDVVIQAVGLNVSAPEAVGIGRAHFRSIADPGGELSEADIQELHQVAQRHIDNRLPILHDDHVREAANVMRQAIFNASENMSVDEACELGAGYFEAVAGYPLPDADSRQLRTLAGIFSSGRQ